MLKPKLLTSLKDYSPRIFISDLIAGMIVGVVALPLAIAFGVCREFEETMRFVSKKPRVQILRLDRVPLIDASGLYVLKSFHKTCQKRNVRLILSGLQEQPLEILKESGLYDAVGKENFTGDIHEALAKAG